MLSRESRRHEPLHHIRGLVCDRRGVAIISCHEGVGTVLGKQCPKSSIKQWSNEGKQCIGHLQAVSWTTPEGVPRVVSQRPKRQVDRNPSGAESEISVKRCFVNDLCHTMSSSTLQMEVHSLTCLRRAAEGVLAPPYGLISPKYPLDT